MLENGLEGDVIALALDGTGYGLDGAVWGGEVLVGTPESFGSVGTLYTLPLPGGEASVKHTWRLALALLHQTDDALLAHGMAQLPSTLDEDAKIVADMLQRQVNCVPCTSLGRLFDAFSALLGICGEATYEAQAAIELETTAARHLRCCAGAEPIPFTLTYRNDSVMTIDYRPAVEATLARLADAGIRPFSFPMMPTSGLTASPAVQSLAAGFIAGVAQVYSQAAYAASQREELMRVVLSGGCFQNKLLLEMMLAALKRVGLEPYTHSAVPMNDAGVSLGQIAHWLSLGR
jgi:hydrogenase maturation protein HypF